MRWPSPSGASNEPLDAVVGSVVDCRRLPTVRLFLVMTVLCVSAEPNLTAHLSKRFLLLSKGGNKEMTLSSSTGQMLHRMLRVNHAGELGADAIYRGQLAVFRSASKETSEKIQVASVTYVAIQENS